MSGVIVSKSHFFLADVIKNQKKKKVCIDKNSGSYDFSKCYFIIYFLFSVNDENPREESLPIK